MDISIPPDLAFRTRALGAVIGSAVGDALGAPFEFGQPGQYSERFPVPVLGGVGEMIGNQLWEPGEFTDDTQMAIVQAESILTHGGIDGSDLFRRFQGWAVDAKDVGTQTSAVLRSELPWYEAARSYYQRNPRNSAGNGSVMRATPTAVLYAATSADETVEAARQTSNVTHGDPAAGWGTALFHLMIRAALRGHDPFVALDAALADLPSDQALSRHARPVMAAGEHDADERNCVDMSRAGCLGGANECRFVCRRTDRGDRSRRRHGHRRGGDGGAGGREGRHPRHSEPLGDIPSRTYHYRKRATHIPRA